MKSPKSTDSVPGLLDSDSDESDEDDPATITNNEMDTHDLEDKENNNLSDVKDSDENDIDHNIEEIGSMTNFKEEFEAGGDTNEETID